MKNLVQNLKRPEANLACTVTIDAAANFLSLQQGKPYKLHEDPNHNCLLSAEDTATTASVTMDEIRDLRMCGVHVVDGFDVAVFKIAKILGVHFRGGEWPQYPRCGSVVTCVVDGDDCPGYLRGRSLYARVIKFLRVDGDDCPGYASVKWFGVPPYVNRLSPKVTYDGSDIEEAIGTVVRITQIDPSPVMVLSIPDSTEYFMIRDSGYDTVPSS